MAYAFSDFIAVFDRLQYVCSRLFYLQHTYQSFLGIFRPSFEEATETVLKQ